MSKQETVEHGGCQRGQALGRVERARIGEIPVLSKEDHFLTFFPKKGKRSYVCEQIPVVYEEGLDATLAPVGKGRPHTLARRPRVLQELTFRVSQRPNGKGEGYKNRG